MKVTVEAEDEEVFVETEKLGKVYNEWEEDFGEAGADQIWESLKEIGIVLEW